MEVRLIPDTVYDMRYLLDIVGAGITGT
ncbi:hypothetical protein ACNEP5_27440 [Escherichia coli]